MNGRYPVSIWTSPAPEKEAFQRGSMSQVFVTLFYPTKYVALTGHGPEPCLAVHPLALAPGC